MTEHAESPTYPRDEEEQDGRGGGVQTGSGGRWMRKARKTE